VRVRDVSGAAETVLDRYGGVEGEGVGEARLRMLWLRWVKVSVIGGGEGCTGFGAGIVEWGVVVVDVPRI
jgi:hypothetical protein